jgi:hypothetical protein
VRLQAADNDAIGIVSYFASGFPFDLEGGGYQMREI